MVELSTGAREYAEPRRGQEVILIGVTTKLGPCQVRSKTEHPCPHRAVTERRGGPGGAGGRGRCRVRGRTEPPCPHRAVTEIRGIPFCERCAREQEAYFAIG